MNTKTADSSLYDTIIKLLILFAIIAWCLMIMSPFFNIILWTLVLAMAMYPLHKSLSEKLGGKTKLASFLIVFVFMAIVIIPSLFLIGSLTKEVRELKANYANGTLTIPPPDEKVREWPVIGDQLYNTWQAASVNLKDTIVQYKDQLTGVMSKLAKGIMGSLSAVVQILAAFLLAGILLVFKKAPESVGTLFRKLGGEKGDVYREIILKTVSNVVKGILGVALILALLHGVLFALAGIPFAGLLAVLVFVLGVLQIPLLLITVPIIIYMFAMKEPVPATIWTIVLLLAGLSDNFLKPILLGKGAPVPMVVIYIGVIGGFILSGFIGLFTGAIVLSIGYKLFEGWVKSDETNAVESRAEFD
jgi:predicted PurR-regulated permease PerM